MNKEVLEIGDIVQLNPEHKQFPGFLIVVTEPKSWGCQGYLMSATDFDAVKYKGRSFLRANFEEFEKVGKLHWIHGGD